MHRISEPYIPKDANELINLLGSMMLGAPTFEDKTGYFVNRNIDTEFASLNGGLTAIRKKIGEEYYQKLVDVSARMQSHFAAGLENQPEEVSRGRRCIEEMEDILRAAGRPRKK